ncbi:MAG: MAPEG family protein [Sphingomonadaceae bacterium]
MILPVTLSASAAAAFLTIWLMIRCGRVRMQRKILHGDGGDDLLARRMRAQLNFVESAPFILALIAGIELAGKGGLWLSVVAGLWVIARVLHPFGMDRTTENYLRASGVIITALTLAGLAIYASLVASGMV